MTSHCILEDCSSSALQWLLEPQLSSCCCGRHHWSPHCWSFHSPIQSSSSRTHIVHENEVLHWGLQGFPAYSPFPQETISFSLLVGSKGAWSIGVCLARPGPSLLKKAWALALSSQSLIWTCWLFSNPPSSPSKNRRNCFTMIPSTKRLVAARISASIDEREIEAWPRLWLWIQQPLRKSNQSLLTLGSPCSLPNRYRYKSPIHRASHHVVLNIHSILSKLMRKALPLDSASACPGSAPGSYQAFEVHKEQSLSVAPCSLKEL